MLENPHLRLLRRDTIASTGLALLGESDYIALGYVAKGFNFRPHFREDFRQGVVAANPTTLYYSSRISGSNLSGKGDIVGNVVSILDLPDNLHPGPDGELAQVCQMMRELCGVVGAKYWTGLGRIPAVIGRTRTPVDEMFIAGDIGSRTTVRLSLEQLLAREHLDSGSIMLGVLGGGGVLGSSVARSARDRGFNVIAYDIGFRGEQGSENLLITNEPQRLVECNVLINAASEGDALATVIPYLQERVLVLDDTHPRPSQDTIRQVLRVGRLFWVGVQREGVSIDPPFPGRVSKEIAGCLLETIVAVMVGFRTRNPQFFYEMAKKLGFETLHQEVAL